MQLYLFVLVLVYSQLVAHAMSEDSLEQFFHLSSIGTSQPKPEGDHKRLAERGKKTDCRRNSSGTFRQEVSEHGLIIVGELAREDVENECMSGFREANGAAKKTGRSGTKPEAELGPREETQEGQAEAILEGGKRPNSAGCSEDCRENQGGRQGSPGQMECWRLVESLRKEKEAAVDQLKRIQEGQQAQLKRVLAAATGECSSRRASDQRDKERQNLMSTIIKQLGERESELLAEIELTRDRIDELEDELEDLRAGRDAALERVYVLEQRLLLMVEQQLKPVARLEQNKPTRIVAVNKAGTVNNLNTENQPNKSMLSAPDSHS